MRYTNIFSQEQVEAFLLGECEEALALQIEERLFSDDLFYQRMQDIKASLIAREANGTLSKAQSQKLNRQIQRSNALRLEMDQARMAETGGRKPNAASGRNTILELLTARPFIRVLFACVLIAVAGLSLVWITSSNHLRSLSASKEISSNSSSDSHKKSSVEESVTFFLSAGVLRDESRVPVLHLHQAQQLVTLQVETRDTVHSDMSVMVFGKSGVIFQRDHLNVRNEGPLRFVSIVMPPGLLQPGPYRIRVSGEQTDSKSSLPSAEDRPFDVRY